MADAFQIRESSKAGLESEESLIVERGGISFLRILGGEPRWTLMTATADEDGGQICACPDQSRLIESATLLCAELGGYPRMKRDRAGREYVEIGVFHRESGENDEDFHNDSNALFRRFFEIFDGFGHQDSQSRGQMRELYGAVATDDEGGDVYLSDGVWLSSDGSLRDRGR